ncbi:glycosyltransferase [Rhodocytophaga aerolata]|uniref:Glycosyltransferase n=1 Tax=Rhodocytophaga aerolata TaxID=455078 RepID=A0ABT8RIM4_9BACT|nr:glycosyltransferase [Rhodocytophaga aerolata]MDO1451018.1 glycosyltransferase [Rhodocytophaga aerolata]
METSPLKVSVVMPVYNGESYIKEAITSILYQTFIDFEFIIINDGSTDASVRIIESFKDKRIRLIHNDQNIGLTATLNKGIDLAKGEYIARMDADDVSLEERLAKQVTFLDQNPDIGVCGTWFKIINTNQIIERPNSFEDIKLHLLCNNAFGHSTVMMRKSFLKNFGLLYNIDYRYAQDYELWVRCYAFFRLANISEVLVLYRLHNNQMTETYGDVVDNEKYTIQLLQLQYLNIVPAVEEEAIHKVLINNYLNADKVVIQGIPSWIKRLKVANKKNRIFAEPHFSLMLDTCKQEVYSIYRKKKFRNQKIYNLFLLHEFYTSATQPYRWFEVGYQIKFVLKCLIGWKARV